MSMIHVALIEDDADDQFFITSALNETAKNLVINTFSNGKDFLEHIKADEKFPDIVLTDIRMPLVSGFEVIRALRQNPKTKEIPVMVISTSSDDEDVQLALSLGANDYFVKPITLTEYCDITTRILKNFNDAVLPFSQKIQDLFRMLKRFLNRKLVVSFR